MSLPIDRVVIRSNGSSHELTTREFMSLELPVRIRHVIAGEVTFFSGYQQVPQSEALRALQTQRTPSDKAPSTKSKPRV